MSLEAFVFMLLGITVELLWLWGNAHESKDTHRTTRIVASPIPMHWSLASAAGVIALLAVLLLRLFKVHETTTSLDYAVPFFIFTMLGVFTFFAGVIGSGLLPQINEKSIIATQLIVLFGVIWGGGLPVGWGIGLALVPGLIVLLLVLRRRPFGPVAKALLYLWYLILLVVQVYLDRETMAYFSEADLSLPAAFMVGATLVFLVLHGLFAVRFVLIASSLVFAKNRSMVGELMPRLFQDEQISPLRFFAVLSALIVGLAGVVWLKLAPSGLLLNAAVLISVQLLFRSQPRQSDLASLR